MATSHWKDFSGLFSQLEEEVDKVSSLVSSEYLSSGYLSWMKNSWATYETLRI